MVAMPLPLKVRNRKRSPFLWFAIVVVPPTHMAVPLGHTWTFCWKNQRPTVAEPFGEKRVEPK